MDNKTYYGVEDSKTFTFLEFGEVNTTAGTKKIWGFKLHQTAYDWFMLSRYTNDILAFNKMMKLIDGGSEQEIINCYNQQIHHDDEASLNLSKIIALAATKDDHANRGHSFYELGQTLFGCIDGMDFYQKLLQHLKINCPRINLEAVEWYGVDISDMFNELSEILHKDHRIHTMNDPKPLPDKMDVFFSKGITLLYAVRSYHDLFSTIGRGRLAIFDYSFSLDGDEDTTIGSGKNVRYLNFQNFMKELKKSPNSVYVKKSNSKVIAETNRIWLDCLFADEALCRRYIELDKRIRNEIAGKFSGLKDADRFLNNDRQPEWMSLDEFIKAAL